MPDLVGESAESARVRALAISTQLLTHADECDYAAREVTSSAAQIESIKSEWTRIQRMADRWGIVIKIADGPLQYLTPDDPAQSAEVEHRVDIIHTAIVDLLRRADPPTNTSARPSTAPSPTWPTPWGHRFDRLPAGRSGNRRTGTRREHRRRGPGAVRAGFHHAAAAGGPGSADSGQGEHQVLNALAASGVPIQGLNEEFMTPADPLNPDAPRRVLSFEDYLADPRHEHLPSSDYNDAIKAAINATMGSDVAEGIDTQVTSRYNAVTEDPDPRR